MLCFPGGLARQDNHVAAPNAVNGQARMSDVKVRSQGGPSVGNGLGLGAAEFIPQRPSSTLTLNAAPFVPSSSVASHQGNGSSSRPPAPGAEKCTTVRMHVRDMPMQQEIQWLSEV